MKGIEEFFYAQQKLQSELANLKAEMCVLKEALRIGYAVDAEDFRELKEKLTLVRFTLNSLHGERHQPEN
jgi:hypothetical protein